MPEQFIVEIESGLWLAAIDGDPGRTCRIENARRYSSHKGAAIALGRARRYRPLRNAKVIPINESEEP